jgi:Ig-like domain-containing protein
MTRRSLLGMLLIGILLASCGGQVAADEPTPDIGLTIAAGAETMVAAAFRTQTALAPTATNTPLPTVTPLATTTPLTLPTAVTFPTQAILYAASPTPTGTYYTATPLSSSLASGCRNLRLISSYTVPDGQLSPGTEFTQYWQVENNGTCDWLYVYQLVNVSGDRMGGAPGRFSKRIEPGKWTTLSVVLDAPNSDGTHTATWRFSDGGGGQFGASLPVSITVRRNPDPTRTPNAVETAVAGTVVAQMTQSAVVQQTAVSVGLTAIYCQTAIAQGTPPPCP